MGLRTILRKRKAGKGRKNWMAGGITKGEAETFRMKPKTLQKGGSLYELNERVGGLGGYRRQPNELHGLRGQYFNEMIKALTLPTYEARLGAQTEYLKASRELKAITGTDAKKWLNSPIVIKEFTKRLIPEATKQFELRKTEFSSSPHLERRKAIVREMEYFLSVMKKYADRGIVASLEADIKRAKTQLKK